MTELRTLHKHTAPVSSLSYDMSGRLLVSGGSDGVICCWKVSDLIASSPLVDSVGNGASISDQKQEVLGVPNVLAGGANTGTNASALSSSSATTAIRSNSDNAQAASDTNDKDIDIAVNVATALADTSGDATPSDTAKRECGLLFSFSAGLPGSATVADMYSARRVFLLVASSECLFGLIFNQKMKVFYC